MFLLNTRYVVCLKYDCDPERNYFIDYVCPVILEVPRVVPSVVGKVSVCMYAELEPRPMA